MIAWRRGVGFVWRNLMADPDPEDRPLDWLVVILIAVGAIAMVGLIAWLAA